MKKALIILLATFSLSIMFSSCKKDEEDDQISTNEGFLIVGENQFNMTAYQAFSQRTNAPNMLRYIIMINKSTEDFYPNVSFIFDAKRDAIGLESKTYTLTQSTSLTNELKLRRATSNLEDVQTEFPVVNSGTVTVTKNNESYDFSWNLETTIGTVTGQYKNIQFRDGYHFESY